MCPPPRARSTGTAVPHRGRSYSQSPSCGGGEPLPVTDLLLPVFHKHKRKQPVKTNNVNKTLRCLMCLRCSRCWMCSRCYLRVLQRPQVQQMNVARQRGAERQEGAEFGQLSVTGGGHGDWWVVEGERGQVGEQ